MRKLLFKCSVLAVVFMMAGCSDVMDDVSPQNLSFENSPTYGVKYVDQQQALDAYHNLMEGMTGGQIQTKSSEINYPDYYGGCYIDENNKLVVYTIGDIVQTKSAVVSMAGSDVIIKSGKYSFQMLSDIMKKIGIYSSEEKNKSIVDNIASVSLMDIQNCIVVKLYDCSEQRIDEFKSNVVESPAIVFEKQEKPLELYAGVNVCPGMTIHTTVPFSLGYRVSRGGQIGFITAAHGVSMGQKIGEGISTGLAFATCTYRQWSGTVDAAFCVGDNDIIDSYSNIIKYTSLPLGNTYGTILAGTAVYKSGYKTQNTSGMITSTNSQTTIDGITITDLAMANYYCDFGDSGGVVYTNPYGNQGYPVGIVHGGTTTISSYFVKATNIGNALNCSLYN